MLSHKHEYASWDPYLLAPDPASPVFGATRARPIMGAGELRRCCKISGSTTSPQFIQCSTAIVMIPISSSRSRQVSLVMSPWQRRQITRTTFSHHAMYALCHSPIEPSFYALCMLFRLLCPPPFELPVGRKGRREPVKGGD